MVDKDEDAKQPKKDDPDLDEDWEDNEDGDDGEEEDSDEEDSDEEDSDEEDSDEEELRSESSAPPGGGRGAATRAATSTTGARALAPMVPVKLLGGAFAVLALLTVGMVALNAVGLGSQLNFIAMLLIATLQAGLLMAVFMRLVWDKRFNLVVFLGAFFFLLLFLSLTSNDRSAYQNQIDSFEADQALAAPAASSEL